MDTRAQEDIRFLKLEEVCSRIGVEKSKLYKMIREGGFPKPVKLGSASLWADVTVREWQLQKIREAT